jgi:hypothetical protein
MRYPCTLLLVFRSASFSQAHAPPNARLFPKSILSCVVVTCRLCDELDDTTGLLDLALGVLGEVAGTDDDGDLRDATLAEDLAVAEGEEVEDGGGLGGLVGQVLLALLSGDEGPELWEEER